MTPAAMEATATERKQGVALSSVFASAEPLCRSTGDTSVQSGGDGLSISISCTFDPQLPLATVHAATWSIEQRIRRAVPESGRVIVHAEPAGVPTAV